MPNRHIRRDYYASPAGFYINILQAAIHRVRTTGFPYPEIHNSPDNFHTAATVKKLIVKLESGTATPLDIEEVMTIFNNVLDPRC